MSDVSNATDATPMSDEHAEMLATKWWSGDRFRQHGECKHLCVLSLPSSLTQNSGVPCRDGPFALAETELVQDAINKYRTVKL
jgi:hypothetical protein